MSSFGFLPLSAVGAGVAGLIMAFLTYGYVRRQSPGNDIMVDIAQQIHTGAMTFLRREYSYLLPFLVVVAALLGFAVGWNTAIAYMFGGICSILAGLFGMQSATQANSPSAIISPCPSCNS